ncbi:CIA30 family protein [Congregibacter litoralis]|uniref:Complex I intermediate-associated protein 30 (CIA30) n=1 Tax=Congregibacter litoralis KT71 TaxID=314285 RepID=A4A5W1_9GAMM|nr:CIA30 family protein [Congregibacter litoralis]EAQ98408.1 Complex I intermediate-associated protein 30 (CIA30) [Congregibacter litoralis KT71]
METSFKEIALIDDFSREEKASNGHSWHYVSDTVMGGISQGSAHHGEKQGTAALMLKGTVSLENNGGFIQAALDLASSGSFLDATGATGIAVSLCGDGQDYAINLRTAHTHRPWQSYRCALQSRVTWKTHYLPFACFEAHRIEQPLDISHLRRIGVIAIGRPGPARVALSRLALYRDGSSG